MKNLAICIFAMVTLNVSAREIQLKKSEEYTVPQGKVWVLKNVKQADCKGCSYHLRVDGSVRIGTNPMAMSGHFNFDVGKNALGEIDLLSGAKLRLDDSSRGLMVIETEEQFQNK